MYTLEEILMPVCPTCRCIFIKPNSTIIKSINMGYYSYCSENCSNIKNFNKRCDKHSEVLFPICPTCGKIFRINDYQVKKNIKQGHYSYCSRECACKMRSKTMMEENDNINITNYKPNLRTIHKMRKWRSKIFKRDANLCQLCNTKNNLIIHHINTLKNIMVKYNIDDTYKANRCKELWDISNGVTLCVKCHRMIHKMGCKF